MISPVTRLRVINEPSDNDIFERLNMRRCLSKKEKERGMFAVSLVNELLSFSLTMSTLVYRPCSRLILIVQFR